MDDRDEPRPATTEGVLGHIVRNAYRALGVPGSASQAAVQSEVGATRRATRLGVATKTDWDLP
jgi:hypothetical protein